MNESECRDALHRARTLARAILDGARRTRTDLRSALDLSDEGFAELLALAGGDAPRPEPEPEKRLTFADLYPDLAAEHPELAEHYLTSRVTIQGRESHDQTAERLFALGEISAACRVTPCGPCGGMARGGPCGCGCHQPRTP